MGKEFGYFVSSKTESEPSYDEYDNYYLRVSSHNCVIGYYDAEFLSLKNLKEKLKTFNNMLRNFLLFENDDKYESDDEDENESNNEDDEYRNKYENERDRYPYSKHENKDAVYIENLTEAIRVFGFLYGEVLKAYGKDEDGGVYVNYC